MDELIAALTILRKYDNPRRPTYCEHDRLAVCVSPRLVSEEDLERLKGMGFRADYDNDDFYSYRYGAA